MKIKQTKEDLKHHLREQIDFLLRSAKAYDEDYISEAKRLAVAIRVLLHDAKWSTSLLKQLKKKDISFYDTALDYDPKNPVSTTLVMIKLGPEGGYVPPLDKGPPERYIKGKISFEDWWNKILFADEQNNKLSRKDLILSVSNKDGGAHVDPELNGAYADLTHFKSQEWKFIYEGREKNSATQIELASVRQIAHEVIKSLKDEFPDYFK
jgi:hypothetical protein